MIGTGRAADRDTALGLGVNAFLDPQADKLEDAGEADVVFDVIGGEVLDRSAALVRADGALVTIARMPTVQPKDGRAIFFVVNPTAPGLWSSPSGSGTDGSNRSSGRYGRSPKRPLRLPPTGAPPARRSSGSPKADSPIATPAAATPRPLHERLHTESARRSRPPPPASPPRQLRTPLREGTTT